MYWEKVEVPIGRVCGVCVCGKGWGRGGGKEGGRGVILVFDTIIVVIARRGE